MNLRLLSIGAISLAFSGCQTQPSWTPPPPRQLAQAPFPSAPDGFFVTKYPDGSGWVGRSPDILADHWSIDCAIDQMADKRKCSITSKSGGPFIYYGFSSSPQSVCILGHDFPGRSGQIRIDKGAPITTDTDGCVPASRVIGQMKTGTTFLSRWVKWPYDYSRDDSVSLDGLNKAMSVVAEIQKGNTQ
ncbi:hypothetical protein [Brucella endophytica]|uniref:hypothetical protein n=1 Tax=Brucella endophytica TaxID=1963359 RepID=UPI00166E778B|nr:hypothetical protein [Brucella endophytica]